MTVGRNTDGKGFFYDIKIEDTLNTEKHDVEYKLDLIQALGCKIDNKELEVWCNEFDIKKVEDFLKNNSISDSDMLIGINPGAHRPSHRWDWKNFAEVADALAVKYKARIIITGAKNESWLGKRINHIMINKPINAMGKLSLTQLIALIRRCNLFITNDTGPMHIANALKIPLIAIMGPGSMKTAPYQNENCIILNKKVSCYPCYKFKCNDMRCLKSITVNDVIQAANILLEKNVKI
jgi:heptosyltransferase-2